MLRKYLLHGLKTCCIIWLESSLLKINYTSYYIIIKNNNNKKNKKIRKKTIKKEDDGCVVVVVVVGVITLYYYCDTTFMTVKICNRQTSLECRTI